MAPACASLTNRLSPEYGNARWKKGPTVCPGVQANSTMVTVWFSPGSRAAGQHDVPPVTGRVLGLSQVMVVGGDQPLARNGIHDGLVDGIQTEQRVARKVHLGDQTLGESGSEHREVNVRRTPGILVITPWVGTRLDGQKAIRSVGFGQATAHPGEVRIDRRRVVVALVVLATGSIGLPDLDELARHRPTRCVPQPPGHDDALPDGLAGMAGGEVGVDGVDVLAAEARGPALNFVRVDADERGSRMAQQAAAVRRVVQPRLGALFPVVVSRDAGDLHRYLTLRHGAG